MVTSSKLEKLIYNMYAKAREYTVPLLSCLVFGLAAYMFVFTNKLLNLDELAGLFGKGETISSGRWALYLTSYIFPDYSMPWINGILCIALFAVSVCLITAVFEIKEPVYQLLLAGLFVAFPSEAVTLVYMFTCTPYALAVLFAVLSVYLTLKGSRAGFAIAVVLMCLSLGVYQAYITLAASLYVVFLIWETLKGEREVHSILLLGVKCAANLLFSLILYFVINKAVMHFAAAEYNSYASAAMNSDIKSLLSGLRVAFTAFFGYFLKGHYHLAPTKFSMLIHTLCAAIIALGLIIWLVRSRDRGRKLLLIVLLALFPINVNCIYIISSQRHTLMLLGFTSVYVLCVVTLRAVDIKKLRASAVLCLSLILVCNIFYSNTLYLKLKLEYEEAYGFYSGLITRVKSTEGYDADTMLIINGDATEKNLVFHADEIDTSDLVGIMEGLLNIYSRYDFIKYYVGYDYNPIDWDGWVALDAVEEVEEMPIYPYDGSVKKIGDYMVVKLG